MLMCMDCKSNNIIDTNIYQAYFREGDYIRLRNIIVFQNMNDNTPKGFMSYSEHSLVITAIGDTELESIEKLGKLLKNILHVELLGKVIDD